MFSVRFWGVRGSIPCPGRSTLRFGGNTSCLEIRAGERLIIVDMGTGVKLLGDHLMANDYKNGPLDIDIFISHTHWDHIMGLPMFTPIFVPRTKIRIWSSAAYDGESLKTIIGEQLSYKYWPVRLGEFVAQVEFREIRETSLDLGGGLKLTSKYLNHSMLCLGYRFEYQGKSIVCAFDHEPFRNIFPSDPEDPGFNETVAREGELAAKEENEKILRFYQGADILVHDTQFLSEEFESRIGWGHSSYEYAMEAASEAGVKKLVFFHHDPCRSDEQLKFIEKNFKNKPKGCLKKIIMAREGLTIEA